MKKNDSENKKSELAVFGGGCFWCLEAVFSKLKGVRSVTSGYSGGRKAEPTYEEVCSGKTGHAEVAKIEYDPAIISYRELLTVFFAMHDPTTPNRQGSDQGTQYRSIILYANNKQKKEAESFIENLKAEKIFSEPIITEIKLFEDFYPAENYHQKYFEKNTVNPYCQLNISPKIAKLQEKFAELVK
ncbi:MAG TPA: peptide-methionine (S)-S-oxide reductase MsrA [Candidatus Bathyarchaeia archaeon]|nr:peptide-methionine (S)-S-oxide reductase MsrA [Candidatus Bathyarchaeia archaeon]